MRRPDLADNLLCICGNWLNLHPLKDDPQTRLICNLYDGTAVGPKAMWGMMKRLRQRIEHMLKQGSIIDPKEREKLEYLLRTKKWNPYCIRHSATTFDSDLLSDYAQAQGLVVNEQ